MIRYTLVVRHGFLQSKEYRRLNAAHSEDVVCPTHTHVQGDDKASENGAVCLKEVVYHPDSSCVTPMCAEYRVSDLSGLTKLLTRGVDVALSIRRLTYVKRGEEELVPKVVGNGKLATAGAAGSKSGRKSVQSRQPSASKVSLMPSCI